MKILQVITRAETIGGAQRHVLDLAIELQSIGDSVTVVSGKKGEFSDYLQKNNIAFVELPSLQRSLNPVKDIYSILKLRRVIKRIKPDVIALHSVKAGLLGRIASINLKKRVFFTAHGWSHIRKASFLSRFFYLHLERILSNFSDKVVCVSNSDLYFALDEIKISQKRLSCIENGVKAVSLVNKANSPYSEKLQLISVVRYQAPKDFHTLLEGLSRTRGKNWELKILGDGDEMECVQELVNSLGLASNVMLLGFCKELDSFYMDSDAILLISKSEGLPMSLIEGMSYSLPLIASNVGGIPELIKHKENGFLIQDGNFQQVADAIDFLNDNRHEVIKMGKRSLEIFEEKYTFDTMFKKVYSLYTDK